ncbi:hypothetical protein Tsubulata_044023, partial [Turnera subulata]
MGRAEIDTRAPFRSVKEAVMLFGERVLVGEIYANKLKEKRAGEMGLQTPPSRVGALATELEETKLSLQKAREESSVMAYCIKSLKEELEQAKKELQRLKAREMIQKQPLDDPEIEDLKFIENAIKVEIKGQTTEEQQPDQEYFQKKRYVKFASPPSLEKVIVNKDEMPGRTPPLKKTMKKRSIVPIIGWLFSKRKGSGDEYP